MKPSEYLSLSERLDRIEAMVKALVEFHAATTEHQVARALDRIISLSEELSAKKDLTTPDT